MFEWLALPSWVLSWRLSLPVTSTQQRPHRGEEGPRHRNTLHRMCSTQQSCLTWRGIKKKKSWALLSFPFHFFTPCKETANSKPTFKDDISFLLRVNWHRHQRHHVFFDVYFYEAELLGPPTPVPGLSEYGNAAKQGRWESLEKFEITSTGWTCGRCETVERSLNRIDGCERKVKAGYVSNAKHFLVFGERVVGRIWMHHRACKRPHKTICFPQTMFVVDLIIITQYTNTCKFVSSVPLTFNLFIFYFY